MLTPQVSSRRLSLSTTVRIEENIVKYNLLKIESSGMYIPLKNNWIEYTLPDLKQNNVCRHLAL